MYDLSPSGNLGVVSSYSSLPYHANIDSEVFDSVPQSLDAWQRHELPLSYVLVCLSSGLFSDDDSFDDLCIKQFEFQRSGN